MSSPSKRLALLAGLVLLLAARLPGETLRVLDPAVVSPDTPAARALASEALAGAVPLVNQRYGNYLKAVYGYGPSGAPSGAPRPRPIVSTSSRRSRA